jgi:type II secretion system protein N
MRHALALLVLVACRSGEDRREIHMDGWNAGGLPITGDIRIVTTGVKEGEDLSAATGTVEVRCGACVIGGTKLSVPARRHAGAWGDQSLTIPAIDLGTVTGRLAIERGHARVEGASDGQLGVSVSGTIRFAPRVGDSAVDVTYVLTPRADLEEDVRSLFWAFGSPDSSGAVTFRVSGTLDRPRLAR